MQTQVRDRQALRVQRAHDLRDVADALRQPRGDAVAGGGRLLAEAAQHGLEALAVAGILRDHLHAGAPDGRLQLGRRALGHDRATVDDPHAVGQYIRLLEVLRGQEHRHAVVGQPSHLIPQRRSALRVEAGGGLVEEQQPRAMHERQAEVQPPLHPAGVAAHLAVGSVRQPDALEQLRPALVALGLAQPVQRALQAHVLAARQERVECRLLQRRADRAAHLRALVHHVQPRHARAAGGGGQQRGEHQHRG